MIIGEYSLIIPRVDAIPIDTIENVAGALNDNNRYTYSHEQVKTALWKFLTRCIEDAIENLEDEFLRQARADPQKYLGNPDDDQVELDAEDYAEMRREQHAEGGDG